MNFLAHLYLADNCPEALVGSVMPDLARTRQFPPHLPQPTLDAIAQHRRVDAFTDMHPFFLRSKSRLFEKHGRYSGILVDIFYDHFLALHWTRYHSVTLSDFVARVHDVFRLHAHLMPDDMRYPIDRLIEQDWLGSYASTGGIRVALERLSIRLSQRFEREVDLARATDDLIAQHGPLADDFAAFFPQLIAFAAPQHPHRLRVA